MTALINILVAFMAVLIGYFIGAIPSGVIIGKLFYKKDPRDYGSHSSGGTNSSRVLSKKAGLIVILADIIKTCIAFFTVWAIVRFSGIRNIEGAYLWDDGVFYVWLTLLGVSIGHCWPVYIHFKGGKTVAVYMGACGGTSWVMYIICHLAFFLMYARGKKKVSYASIISGGIILASVWITILITYLTGWGEGSSILMWNFGFGGGLYYCWEQGVVLTIIYIILVVRHRQNIVRLKNGTEGSINLFGK